MRPLELLLFVLNINLTVLWIKGYFQKGKWAQLLAFSTFFVAILHVVLERGRLQLFPLYLSTFTFLILARPHQRSGLKPLHKRLLTVSLCLFILLSTAMTYAFPVEKMPTPSGIYPIGTVSFDLTDESRPAIYSPNLQAPRRFKVQIWYPAQTAENFQRIPWLEQGNAISKALSQSMKLPDFTFNHLSLITSNAYENAPINLTKGNYPVVIISHGWTGFKALHSDVAETLASSGYIVIGIDHTYGSLATVFADGTTLLVNQDALPNRDINPDFSTYAATLVATYAGDVSYVLDALDGFNQGTYDKRFKDKMDLTKIGLLGHSTGGGADVFVALTDPRIQAIMGLDAWVEPVPSTSLSQGLKIPSLFLRSGTWEVGINNDYLLPLIDKSSGPTALYQLNGTTHSDFTMAYMFSPFTKNLHITGDLDGRISAKIQKDFILGFFNQTLYGDKTVQLDAIADNWKEVVKIK